MMLPNYFVIEKPLKSMKQELGSVPFEKKTLCSLWLKMRLGIGDTAQLFCDRKASKIHELTFYSSSDSLWVSGQLSV